MASDEELFRTFSLDVGTPGAASLRTTIMKKLPEFMGSYTDDVLAEYVVVLVGHGKHRTQAIKDLEAFLGDQSEAFVTWLWDHLQTNIQLYNSDTKESSLNFDKNNGDLVREAKDTEDVVKGISAGAKVNEANHAQVPSEGGRLITLRRDSDRKSTKEVNKASMLTNTQVESNSLTRERSGTAVSMKRSRSPDSRAQTEKQKRHSSPPHINVTRRLLQSAVREAVAPSTSHMKRPMQERIMSISDHSKRVASSMKRLQSVVSTDNENSETVTVQHAIEEQQRPASRQNKRAMPAIMMAMKAAAAAAEDAAKARGKHSGNIWDRLGKKSTDAVENKDEEHERYVYGDSGARESKCTNENEDGWNRKRQRLERKEIISEESIEDDAVVSGSVYNEYTDQSASSRNVYAVRDKGRNYNVERNGEYLAADYNEKEEGNVRVDDRQRQSREESVTVEYRLARNTQGAAKESHKQKSGTVSSTLANPSQKIVNISVNVNTWKHGNYEASKDTGSDEQVPSIMIANQSNQSHEQLERVTVTNASPADLEEATVNDVRVAKEAANVGVRQTETTRESQNAAASSLLAGTKQARKPDDAESRTVFVTNIHFAASKESVMAHFASCGDIARVVMLTDGATGQPKGSAYIEFKAKDAADRALALNESSFFSRALKVVRKDAAIQAIQEMNPLIHPALIRRPIPLALRLPLRGRFVRGSPYALPRRFPAMPRPYGNFPSLQWKRDATAPPSSGAVNPLLANGNRLVRPTRSLSYVRAPSIPGAPPVKVGEEPASVVQESPNVQNGDVEMEQA